MAFLRHEREGQSALIDSLVEQLDELHAELETATRTQARAARAVPRSDRRSVDGVRAAHKLNP